MVAIAKERLGNEEFTEKWWRPPAELYFEQSGDAKATHGIFKASNGATQGLSGLASYVTGGAVAQNVKRVDGKGIDGDMKGEGTILGAVLVVDKTGKLLLHHREKTWGDHPSDEELAAAIAAM